MKKLTLAAALAASAFAMGANAGTHSTTLDITGKIIPAACAISTDSAGGTIDFGTILSAELTNSRFIKKKTTSLSINCETETTALVKVTGSNGADDNNLFFKTDKDFATYGVVVKNFTVDGGNATNVPLVTKTAQDVVDMNSLNSTTFKKTTAGATFPGHGQYFGAAATDSTVGTFKTLTAELGVTAVIDSEKAKTAVKGGEQTFSSMVTFELNYL
ncbi:fimbrial protein [Cronobacter sakazakii]